MDHLVLLHIVYGPIKDKLVVQTRIKENYSFF